MDTEIAKVGYTYAKRTGSGKFSITGSSLHVAKIIPELVVEEHRYLFDVKHTNLLRCFCVDWERNTVLYETFDKPLRKYLDGLQNRPNNPISPTNLYEVPFIATNDEFGRPLEPLTWEYTTDEYRDVIRSILEVVIFFHSLNLTLHPFKINGNMVMKNDKLMLFKLRTRSDTNLNRKADFSCVVDVIKDIFRGFNIPNDISHLVSHLENYRRPKHLADHLSLIPTSERLQLFKNSHEKIPFLRNSENLTRYDRFENALLNCGTWYNWTRRITLPTFPLGPIHDVFNYSGAKPFNDTGEEIDVNLSFLRFTRHLATHLKEKMHLYKKPFSEIDIDLCIMALFHQKFITLHENLEDENLFTLIRESIPLILSLPDTVLSVTKKDQLKESMGKAYVVFKGKNPGVYDTWIETHVEVNEFKGALYKKFSSREEAVQAFEEYAKKQNPTTSFRANEKESSCVTSSSNSQRPST